MEKISHLQIAATKDSAFAVWQDQNVTSGLNSIFVSSTMEAGKIFRTFKASFNDTDAFDPVISSNGLIMWKALVGDPTIVVKVYNSW
jgi:hypothetical protein